MSGFRDPDAIAAHRLSRQIGVRAFGMAAIMLGVAGVAWGHLLQALQSHRFLDDPGAGSDAA
ncbi:MAG TPA: hypothetical protein VMT38_01480 [Terracidiphilus sp.]|nr:hypothetical protein [Terracidiphilus sp.]